MDIGSEGCLALLRKDVMPNHHHKGFSVCLLWQFFGMTCREMLRQWYCFLCHCRKRVTFGLDTVFRSVNLFKPKLQHFSNLQNALRRHISYMWHMYSKHKLGLADRISGDYSYCQALLPIALKDISNAFWTMLDLSVKIRNSFHYCAGALFYQDHAVCFKTSTSLQCPLCHHSGSALHITSGCQCQTISDMTTERHNIACRLIMKFK